MSMDTLTDERANPFGRQIFLAPRTPRIRPRGTTNNRLTETNVNPKEVGTTFFDPDLENQGSDFTDEEEQVRIWMTASTTGLNATDPQRLPGTKGDPNREDWEPPCCPGAPIVTAEDLDPNIVRQTRACIKINSTAPFCYSVQLKQNLHKGVVLENSVSALFIRSLNASCDRSLACIAPGKGCA